MRCVRAGVSEDATVLQAAWREEMIALLEADGEAALLTALTTRRVLRERSWEEHRGGRRSISELHAATCACPPRGRAGAAPRGRAGAAPREVEILDALSRGGEEVGVAVCVGIPGLGEWREDHLECHGEYPDHVATECAELSVRGQRLSPWTVQAACWGVDPHPRLAEVRGAVRARVRARLRQIPAARLGNTVARLYWLGGEEESRGEAAARIEAWTELLERACARGAEAAQARSSPCAPTLVVVSGYEYDAPWYASNVVRLWMEELASAGPHAVGVVCHHVAEDLAYADGGVARLVTSVGVDALPGGVVPTGTVLECFAGLLAETGGRERGEVIELLAAASDALAV